MVESNITKNQNGHIQEKKQSDYKAKLSLKQKQNKIDKVWRILFITISIMTIPISTKVYRFQTSAFFKHQTKGDLFEMLLYGLPFAIVFAIIDEAIHKIFDPLCEKYVINHQKFPDPIIRKNRCFTLVKWAYSLFYYGISSIAAYILLLHTDILPFWLAGNGSCMNIMKDHPSIPVDSNWLSWMKVFYIIQFGKHFSRTFTHIFIRAEGNFYEYGLHHALSTYLIVISYLINFWLFGIVVLLLHDASDFFLILARFYREVRNRKQYILYIFYLFAMSSWLGLRVFGFTSCCIIPAYSFSFFSNYKENIRGSIPQKIIEYYFSFVDYPGWFLTGMMSILLVLQLFWTYYIGQSFVATVVSQKITTHNYD